MSISEGLFLGLLMPFVGTSLGSACVFFMKGGFSPTLQKYLNGFASGVMTAASIWSLIIPATEMASAKGRLAFLPALMGVWAGVVLMLVIDRLISEKSVSSGLIKEDSHQTAMLVLAVTIHNIPEGMAVGVLFSACLSKSPSVTLAGALMLAFGIAVQNFPEGAVISMPLRADGMKRNKSFLFGVMSGITEPIAAGITILFSGIITPLLPYLLSFAAGAMIYVVVDRLIPESASLGKSLPPSVVFCLGFTVMMALDVALG